MTPNKPQQEINQAIATATKGQIPQLLRPGQLQDIGWVLTDALYLDAEWATPFDPLRTVRVVHHRRRPPVTAQFMTGGQYHVSGAAGNPVWLPLGGGKLAMEALLPPAGGLHDASRGVPRRDDSLLASGWSGALTGSITFPR